MDICWYQKTTSIQEEMLGMLQDQLQKANEIDLMKKDRLMEDTELKTSHKSDIAELWLELKM